VSGERGLLFYISFYLLLFMITTNSHLLLFLSFFSFFSFQLRFLFTSHRIASHHITSIAHTPLQDSSARTHSCSTRSTSKGRGAYQNENRTRHDGVGLSKRKEKEKRGGGKRNQNSSSRKRIINNPSRDEWRGEGVRGE